MYLLTKNKIILLKVLSVWFIFNTTLFAGKSYEEEPRSISNSCITLVGAAEVIVVMPIRTQEHVSVSLSSFGNGSMIVMLLFTSLLGIFFVRHELSSLFE